MKKQQLLWNGNILTVEYPTIGKRLVVDCGKFPKEIFVPCDASRHGMGQKFGDAASGGEPSDKFTMATRINESLLAGDWELTGTHDTSAIIIEAICNLKHLQKAAVRKITDKNPEKIKEWGTNVAVKAEVAKIRAARAATLVTEDDVDIDL